MELLVVCPQSDPAHFFLHARTSGLSSLCGEFDNEQKIALWKILILTTRWPNRMFKGPRDRYHRKIQLFWFKEHQMIFMEIKIPQVR